MPLVYFIRVSQLFLESNLLGMKVISDPKIFGKYPWKIRRFRDEKGRRKVGIAV